MNKLLGYLLLISFFISGCVNYMDDSNTQQEGSPQLPRELTAAEEELVRAEQSFSYEIFNRITEEDDRRENILIAPMSLSLALGTTLNGASGETREEMQEALNFGEIELQELNDSFQSLMELILNLNPQPDMKIANAIWYRVDTSVREEFVSTAENYFNSEVLGLDARNRQEAADIINNWVENRTGGNIDHVVNSVSRFMDMYLISAIYFKGNWLYEFDPELTRQDDFYLNDGSSVQVEMMEQEAELAAYISDEVWMTELPYSDDLFRMTLLMPGDPQESIDEFVEESLTAENMERWVNELTTAGILVRVPKFELEYEQSLEDVLESMGMDEAFEWSADFDYISEQDRLHLNELRHKTRIVIDEEGSGATPASVESERRIDFNRPFVFLIREKHSGVILFMGKVKDPSR